MVRWSVPARNALLEFYSFIAQDSKFYAKKVIEEIVEKTKSLDDFPMLGRMVPETNTKSIRELFAYSYRIIYQLSASHNIEILAVVHGKRDLDERLLKR